MFRKKKFPGFLSVALFPVFSILFSGFVFAGEKIPDADGDLIPDQMDPAPLCANLPFHWSVSKISCQFPDSIAHTNISRFPLFEAKSSVRLSSPSSMTAVPVFKEAYAARGFLPALGVFGRGTVPWGEMERQAVLRARAAIGTLDAETPVDFTFVVYFTNLSAEHLRLAGASIPVELGGKTWANALPVDEQARAGGFLLVGDGKTYRVPFVATMAARDARAFLDKLANGSESPDFSLLDAKGATVITEDGRAVVLDETFRSILKKTVPVLIEGPAGKSWLWRIAVKGPDGERTTISDWADEVNAVAIDRDFLGLPLIAFSKDGLLLSLVGWDSGNWDDWWQPSIRGRDLKGFDWNMRKCEKGVRFSLRHNPPELSSEEREFLDDRRTAAPVYSTLLGITLWNEGEKKDSLRYFREAASAGSAQACSWLGFALNSIMGTPSNQMHSAMNYKRAADMGYAPGQAWYGNCLLRGIGTKANFRKALVYLKQASEQKFPEGQALYGLCLLRGVGGKADIDTALKILLDAAGRGDLTAQYGLGIYLLQTGKSEGLEWVRLAALGGSERAQMKLADIFQFGKFGLPRDATEAARWLKAAADQGNTRALIALGEAYRGGNGVSRNLKASADCFLRAAQAGDRKGQTWYALCLLDGLGVRRNATEAVQWLEKAAQRGYPEAQYILGLCLYGGIGGIETDKEAAVRWLLAASPAQLQARVFLGYCFFIGDGVAQNKTQAVRFFAAAAREGSVPAQLWLAYCFANGEGVTINWKEARKWAQAAADRGSPAGRKMLEQLSLK